jgi:hypothetical protein
LLQTKNHVAVAAPRPISSKFARFVKAHRSMVNGDSRIDFASNAGETVLENKCG